MPIDHQTLQPLPLRADTDITDETRAFYGLCERTRDHAWEVLALLRSTQHRVAEADSHMLRVRTRNDQYYGDDLRAAADRALRRLESPGPDESTTPLAHHLRILIGLSWQVRRQRRCDPTWTSLWAEIDRINAGKHIIRCPSR